jgi:hypothetical protein
LTAASRLAFSLCLMARADFGVADFLTARLRAGFFTGDFFDVEVLPDTPLAPTDFAAGLDDRGVGIVERSQ